MRLRSLSFSDSPVETMKAMALLKSGTFLQIAISKSVVAAKASLLGDC